MTMILLLRMNDFFSALRLAPVSGARHFFAAGLYRDSTFAPLFAYLPHATMTAPPGKTDGRKRVKEMSESRNGNGEKVRKLFEEVELYKQAVEDAKDALASAEMELDAVLEEMYEAEQY